jgi:anti-sigma regulatory factor (Ser/Thr protein kinase)
MMIGPLETRSLTRQHPAAPAQDDPGDWPLCSYLELPAVAESVRSARRHASQTARDWGLQALSDDVALIVSELVTNAVRAAEGLTASQSDTSCTSGLPPVRLWLYSDKQQLMIRVWDGSDQPPILKNADLEADNGRGLELVDALCERWGTLAPKASTGKVVWAVLSTCQS